MYVVRIENVLRFKNHNKIPTSPQDPELGVVGGRKRTRHHNRSIFSALTGADTVLPRYVTGQRRYRLPENNNTVVLCVVTVVPGDGRAGNKNKKNRVHYNNF